MYRKLFRMFLMGTFVLLASCVDDTYDLANKELVTDVKIEGNKLALPLGNLRAIMLDSLLSVEDIDILEQTDGVYSINISDSVPFDVEIDPITLSIPSQKYSTEINFVEVDITEVEIKGMTPQPAVFNVPSVSLDDLNENLPNLSSSVTASLVNDELKTLFETVKDMVGPMYFTPKYTFDSNRDKFTVSDTVSCKMTYELPEQIKSLSTIKLANRKDEEGTSTGSLIQFNVRHPEVLNGVDKTLSFSVEFPESFRISLDKTAKDIDNYVLDNDHKLTVTGLLAEGNLTTIQFYMDELTGLENYIDEANGTLCMDEFIKYSVEYKLDGEITLSEKTELEEFEFSVDMNLPLGFSDIVGETNDIAIDFEPIHMDFHAHFDNLQYIDRIDSILFDAKNSVLIFDTDMAGGFSPFFLKEGYGLKLSFPEELVIDEALSVYPTKEDEQPKIKYRVDEHAFYIYDLEALAHSHWELALDRMILEKPVIDGVFDIDVVAEITAINPSSETTNSLVLAGAKLESLTATLKSLQQKNANFSMDDSHLSINDAIVHTEKIIAPLDTHAEFALNEKVPSEIGRIESIGFVDNVPVTLAIDIDGLEQLETNVNLDLHVALPSFLKLSSNSSEVQVLEDSLLVKAVYNPSGNKPLEINLQCYGLDFMSKDFNGKGLMPKDSTDGNSYLAYQDEIVVVGDAYIDGMEFHSQVLESMEDITVNVAINIGDIEVKDFNGLYRGEFDKIEENIELDLGEGLDFLKDEKNSITLAEPQILIAFENTIGVPVNIDLQLSGKDENGAVIESSVISNVFHIEAAEYDASSGNIIPRQTKLFITSDTSKVSKQGYQNVEIPNLARLLERLPNSISLSVLPVVDQDVTHHVDLSQPLRFKGDYSVIIPLKFEEFCMCYTDTIEGLQVSLGEVMDIFSNISLQAKMNVKNTVPVGLSLSVKALDDKNNVIKDIEIDPLKLSAGNGASILEVAEGEKVQFAIKSKTGDLSRLDKLAFTLDAYTDQTEGGVALKGDQGIQISNIVLEISGDIATELSGK